MVDMHLRILATATISQKVGLPCMTMSTSTRKKARVLMGMVARKSMGMGKGTGTYLVKEQKK